MTRRHFLALPAGVSFVAACRRATNEPASGAAAMVGGGRVRMKPRLLCAIRDRTGSFQRHLDAANAVLRRCVGAMGPGDGFLLIEVGRGFDASRQVREQRLPDFPEELLIPPKTYPEYLRQKAEMERLWTDVETRKRVMLDYVESEPSIPTSSTDIYSALDYAAHRLLSFVGERHLLIASDLVHDMAGVVSDLPPKALRPFPRTRVAALFVPWEGSARASRKAEAWRKYFEAAGAAEFEMYDEAESPGLQPLSSNTSPQSPVNPLTKKRA
jgi:hypothetical protein